MVIKMNTEIYKALDDLKAKTEELEEAKEMYKTLSRVSPVGMFRTNCDGECVYVNKKWLDITGLKKEDAMGDGWRESLHPDDIKMVLEEWSRCIKEKKSFRLEYRFKKKTGKVTWVLGQANVINGGEKGFVGTVTDITKEKKVLPKLLQLQQDLKEGRVKRVRMNGRSV